MLLPLIFKFIILKKDTVPLHSYPSAAKARATLNDFSTGAVSFKSMLAHKSLTIVGVKISPLSSSKDILRRRSIRIKTKH